LPVFDSSSAAKLRISEQNAKYYLGKAKAMPQFYQTLSQF
jgi:hypothetical protein